MLYDDTHGNPNYNNMNFDMENPNPMNQSNPHIPKKKYKNRTLQYYKFLFYAIKLEIQSQSFVKLIFTSNIGEIVLWLLSLILYIATPKSFPQVKEGQTKIYYKDLFIWFHLIHVIRAGFGIFIWLHLPRSYELIETLKSIPEDRLSKTLFNDLAREQIHNKILSPIKEKRTFLFIYATLTFVNFIIDVIDFLVALAGLDKASSDSKVVLLTYLIIAFLYCVIDLSYLLWAGGLKYILPKQYIASITAVFKGSIGKAVKRFKLKKPLTNIMKEKFGKNNASNNSGNNENVEKLPELREVIAQQPGGNNNQQFGLDQADEVNEKDINIDM